MAEGIQVIALQILHTYHSILYVHKLVNHFAYTIPDRFNFKGVSVSYAVHCVLYVYSGFKSRFFRYNILKYYITAYFIFNIYFPDTQIPELCNIRILQYDTGIQQYISVIAVQSPGKNHSFFYFINRYFSHTCIISLCRSKNSALTYSLCLSLRFSAI